MANQGLNTRIRPYPDPDTYLQCQDYSCANKMDNVCCCHLLNTVELRDTMVSTVNLEILNIKPVLTYVNVCQSSIFLIHYTTTLINADFLIKIQIWMS